MARISQFQRAVESTPSIAQTYRPGIQALKSADRKRLADRDRANGSIFLDEALATALPNAHRWDYGIGLPDGNVVEKVLWLEVHHAAGGETDTVLKKLAWLKEWLRHDAPHLDKMPKIFVWQLSNTENNPDDRKRRTQLAEKHGLRRRQGTLRLAAL